jgi:hypothetical protein
MKKVLMLGLILVVVLAAVFAQAQNLQNEIKKELVSALVENREMRSNIFLKEELKNFFSPAFSQNKQERERFLMGIDSKIPSGIGGFITAFYVINIMSKDGSPMLKFEMSQGNHLHCINVFPDGTVSFENGGNIK